MLKIKKTKKEIIKILKNTILIIVGSLIMSIGTGFFYVPCNIVAGGLSGIGIVVEKCLISANIISSSTRTVDITVWILTWVFFFIGLIFLGKKFSLNTLISSICTTIFLTLIYRIAPIQKFIGDYLTFSPGDSDYLAKLLVVAIFGGAFCGVGIAITFFGEGSTGGLDVLQFLFFKWFNIKHSITSFVSDAVIIVAGMFAIGEMLPSLIGIISAFVAALAIQLMYSQANSFYVAEIISAEYEKIMEYIHVNMERGSTIYDVTGGYSSDKKKVIKVAFDRTQLFEFKQFLYDTDPNIFIMLTQMNSIVGLGFEKPTKYKIKKQSK